MEKSRVAAAVVFGLGVLAGIVAGCIFAAYDLWGGVPRSLWRILQQLMIVAVIATISGAAWWVIATKQEERLRATLRAAAALAVIAGLSGGGLFAYYAVRLERSKEICAPARVHGTMAERRQALEDGLGPLFPVIDPHYLCLALLREVRAFDESGVCPSFVPTDVTCKCDAQRWEAGQASVCASGATTCQWRVGSTTLGCPDHGLVREWEDAGRSP